jgi:hypothetical protein
VNTSFVGNVTLFVCYLFITVVLSVCVCCYKSFPRLLAAHVPSPGRPPVTFLVEMPGKLKELSAAVCSPHFLDELDQCCVVSFCIAALFLLQCVMSAVLCCVDYCVVLPTLL